MTAPKDQAPGLVARLRGEGDAHLRGLVRDRRTIGSMMLAGADRITQLEAALQDTLAALEAYRLGAKRIPFNVAIMADRAVEKANTALSEQANIRSPVQSEMAKMVDPRKDEK